MIYIPASSLKGDDVIIWKGEERTVNHIQKYKKSGRKWLEICLVTVPVKDGGFEDVAIPADAMVQWKGQSLF